MWYLAATVMWRLLTPLLRIHPVMVPVSVAVSLLAGLTNNELFDINRMLGFLPFFVIGLHLRPEHLALVRRRGAWVAGVAGMLFLWWLAGRTDRYWATQFLYFRAPYDELGADDLEGIWIRARLIVVALVGTASVLSLVPHRRSFITRMGVWSLVVYLCHGFVVRYLEYRGYEEWMPGASWWSVIITVAVGVALALVIAWEPVARTLNYVVDPINSIGKRWVDVPSVVEVRRPPDLSSRNHRRERTTVSTQSRAKVARTSRHSTSSRGRAATVAGVLGPTARVSPAAVPSSSGSCAAPGRAPERRNTCHGGVCTERATA